MKNIQATIMKQYANSPVILALIAGMNDVLDPQYYIDDFYNLVYRLSTARGFALDIWALKVGASRSAPLSSTDDVFGFEPDFNPFNTFPFSDGGAFASYQLPDEILRKVIIIKAALNILYATAININRFLLMIFEGKRIIYNITGHMKAEYLIEFVPDVTENLIIYTFNMLPKPCGVEISYNEVENTDIFSFNGSGLSTFNNGVFA